MRLESSVGAIRGTLDSGDVDAQTSAGSIALTITRPVRRLSAVTSAGSVDLSVPDDIYRVEATTSAGRTNAQVRTDPASTQQITARSSAGSSTIHRAR